GREGATAGRAAADQLDGVLMPQAAVERDAPEVVPALRETLNDARRELPVGEHRDRRCGGAGRLDDDPWRPDGRGDVRAAVDERGHQLRVDLRLDVAAHRP